MKRYYNHRGQTSLFDLEEPLSKLNKSNRWVRLGDTLSWHEIEVEYNKRLSCAKCGSPNKPARMIVGALIVKHMLGLSDEGTIEMIRENPYMQYLVGLKYFQEAPIFDSSLFVTIRKRLDEDFFSSLELMLYKADKQSKQGGKSNKTDEEYPSDGTGATIASMEENDVMDGQPDKKDSAPSSDEFSHNGTLKIDATCCEAEMRYPTDYNLLEDGSKLIDRILHQVCDSYNLPMPHTHRREARLSFLRLVRKKRKRMRLVSSVKLTQLRCLQADIQIFLDFFGKYTKEILECVKGSKARWLKATFTMFRQQREMFDNNQRACADRIVSIFQPHVRPIVRGKVKAMTEFGAKVGASIVEGYTFVDHISWDAYNESTDLVTQIALYKKRFGCLPAELQADKLYLNRANREYLKSLGITCHCAPLGRPPKHHDTSQEEKCRASGERNEIEATFGTAKRAYGANDIRAKLPDTARSWICCCFFAKNIKRFLRGLFALFTQIPDKCCVFTRFRAALMNFITPRPYSIENLMAIVQ